MYERQWLRQSKIQKYYLYFGDSDFDFVSQKSRDYELYWAVIDGKVRAKHEGKILDAEALFRLRKTQWSPTDMHALPADLELSVEDVKSIWHRKDIDSAPLENTTAKKTKKPAYKAIAVAEKLRKLTKLPESISKEMVRDYGADRKTIQTALKMICNERMRENKG